MRFGADDGFDFTIGIYFDGIQGVDVQRIHHGNGKQQTIFLKRRRLIFMRDISGKQIGKVHIDGVFIRPVFFESQLIGYQINYLAFADNPFTHQKLPQFQIALLLKRQGFFQLLLGQQTAFDQNLT